MIRYTLTALCLLMVAGCSMRQDAPVTIDSALMAPCPPMPMIPTQDDGTIQLGELVLADVELAGLYRECAASKAGLIQAVEELMGD